MICHEQHTRQQDTEVTGRKKAQNADLLTDLLTQPVNHDYLKKDHCVEMLTSHQKLVHGDAYTQKSQYSRKDTEACGQISAQNVPADRYNSSPEF